jgi:predicted phosphodiesterase
MGRQPLNSGYGTLSTCSSSLPSSTVVTMKLISRPFPGTALENVTPGLPENQNGIGFARVKNSIRVHVLSDLHLESGSAAPEPTDADLVVLAGDIHVGTAGLEWARNHFAGKPVVYVLGNHEFYHHSIPELTEELKQASDGGPVHVLENDAVQINGLTVLGCTLWTDYRIWPDEDAAMQLAGDRISDHYLIEMKRHKRLFRPWDAAKIFERSVAWLHEELGKHDPSRTIVVTHHAPSRLSIAPHHEGSALNAAFASNLDELVADSGIPLWVHGHTHDNVDYKIARTRVLTNQGGYAGKVSPGFNPGLIVEE